nr:SDR family oxidoreductase [Pseudomonas aeruginosa]
MSDWSTPCPLFVERAHGARFHDVDGHAYVDFCLGDTGSMFGHSPAPIARALAEQGANGLTTMLPGEDAIVAGELLAQRFGLPFWQVATTATDANRFVLRWARAITGRKVVLVFDGCYHGTVDDTLVNAAGVWREGPVENFTEEDFDLVLGVNLKASFYMCQAAIPYLKENQGSIVNISSDSGRQAYRGSAAYCASKAALTMLSKTLALELAEQGVRVNAVSPADIATPMLDYQAERYGMGNPDGYKRALLKDYPQGKAARFIRPEEVAELVWYLCGPQAEAITGADLAVDFGLSAGR